MGFLSSLLGLQGNSITVEQINLAIEYISSLTDEDKYREYGGAFEKIRVAGISYALAEVAFALSLEDDAKRHCLTGAAYGLKGGNNSYSNGNAEAIGHCISLLMIHLDGNTFVDEKGILEKATAIGYVCLSKHILENPGDSQRARKSRFALLESHKNLRARVNFTDSAFGKNSLFVPVIADLYHIAEESSTSNPLAYIQYREVAKSFRKELSSIAIRGIRGSEMKLKELAGIGELRHKKAYEKALNQYNNGEFDLELAHLVHACNH